MFSVARVAWMFRYYGADNVRIMSGGMKKWLAEGRPVYEGSYEDGQGLPEDNDYSYIIEKPEIAYTNVTDVHDIARKIFNEEQDSEWQITDARPPPSFSKGNITGSINMPISELIDQETGCLKPTQELSVILQSKGISLNKKTLNSCGGGVTACIVDLALTISGAPALTAIYDGSWTEYVSALLFNHSSINSLFCLVQTRRAIIRSDVLSFYVSKLIFTLAAYKKNQKRNEKKIT